MLYCSTKFLKTLLMTEMKLPNFRENDLDEQGNFSGFYIPSPFWT